VKKGAIMCGRYTITSNLRVIQERFDLAKQEIDELIQSFAPNYNVAPTHLVPAIIQDDRSRKLTLLRWGLIPSWAKDAKIGFSTINARSEDIASKPTFKRLIPHQRCLVIADGFYEFRADGKVKHPVRYILKDKNLFAFAGLFDRWKKSSREIITSCTILTTEPNALVRKVHNRMPVMLTRENESRWLDPALDSYDALRPLLKPVPEKMMRAYDANPAVNSVRNNGPHLIEPFDYSDPQQTLL
jgi:putative SOS response-associated peptidase YedK